MNKKLYIQPTCDTRVIAFESIICESEVDGINPPSFDDLGDFLWGMPGNNLPF